MLTETQKEALRLLKTGANVFLTGKAGTGESFVLKEFTKQSKKKILVTAPTGVAAIEIGGATLHRTFGIPMDMVRLVENFKINSPKSNPVVKADIEKCSQFYSNIIYDRDTAKSVINQCSEGQEKLRVFFEETKEYIFKDLLPEIKNLGELENIDNINISIVDLSDKDLLSNKLDEVKKELFTKDQLLESDKELLGSLFNENGLMQKYLNTCNHAYKEIEEEKDNEI